MLLMLPYIPMLLFAAMLRACQAQPESA